MNRPTAKANPSREFARDLAKVLSMLTATCRPVLTSADVKAMMSDYARPARRNPKTTRRTTATR